MLNGNLALAGSLVWRNFKLHPFPSPFIIFYCTLLIFLHQVPCISEFRLDQIKFQPHQQTFKEFDLMTCHNFPSIKYSYDAEISSKSDQRESNGMVIRSPTEVDRQPGP